MEPEECLGGYLEDLLKDKRELLEEDGGELRGWREGADERFDNPSEEWLAGPLGVLGGNSSLFGSMSVAVL